MTSSDQQSVVTARRTEATELLAHTVRFGRLSARLGHEWIASFWKSAGLPVDPDDDLPQWPMDLWLHASAVAMVGRLEAEGFESPLRDDLPTAKEAVAEFIQRLKDFREGDEVGEHGRQLWQCVLAVYMRSIAPQVLNSGSGAHHVGISATRPDDDALQCLAELLLEFCSTIEDLQGDQHHGDKG